MAGLGTLGGGGLLAGKSLAVLGAGLLAGAIGGGALVASGAVHFGGAQGAVTGGGRGLELVPCPDQGPVIGTIPRNQKVLVTGKSADGGWLQLYWPAPGIERAWTRTGPLKLESDLGSLRIASCEAPAAATPGPSVEATPVAAVTPTPTPEPTPASTPAPTPTPTPTPAPTPTPPPTPTPTPTPNTAPKVAGLAASRTTISFDQGAYCPTAPKGTTISVKASDVDGIAAVTLFYRRPGSSSYAQKPMQLVKGAYVATLDTTADSIKSAGRLLYYAVAKDANASPKTSRAPASGALALTVKVCANTGPTITRYASDVANVTTNPLGSDSCKSQYALGTGIEAQATDVDGVASITLYFQGPGMAGTVARPMSLDGDTWYSFINTKDDAITGSGTISWYVVATDKKGASTQSKTQSIGVERCDSPASFDFGGVASEVYNTTGPGCTPTLLLLPVYAQDPDAGYPSGNLSVVVTWSAQNNRGPARGSYSGTVTADFIKGISFQAPVSTLDWMYPGSWTITWTATSTDPYGSTSTSFTARDTFSLLACQ